MEVERSCSNDSAGAAAGNAATSIETVPCDYFLSTMPVKELVAAMETVKCIAAAEAGRPFDKNDLWNVNTEEDYHEGKK